MMEAADDTKCSFDRLDYQAKTLHGQGIGASWNTEAGKVSWQAAFARMLGVAG